MGRGEVIQDMLAVWDAAVKIHPELRPEYEIACEWLTRTWTVEELERN